LYANSAELALSARLTEYDEILLAKVTLSVQIGHSQLNFKSPVDFHLRLFSALDCYDDQNADGYHILHVPPLLPPILSLSTNLNRASGRDGKSSFMSSIFATSRRCSAVWSK
jgi:hypothetical protein